MRSSIRISSNINETWSQSMQYFVAYLTALLIFGIIDLVWLSTMGAALYRAQLGDILLQSIRIAPAIAFYALFPIGIVVFAIKPAIEANSIIPALLYGLLFGALSYATYDLTNFATLRNWNLQITVIDLGYGAVASAGAAAGTILLLRSVPVAFGGIR